MSGLTQHITLTTHTPALKGERQTETDRETEREKEKERKRKRKTERGSLFWNQRDSLSQYSFIPLATDLDYFGGEYAHMLGSDQREIVNSREALNFRWSLSFVKTEE